MSDISVNSNSRWLFGPKSDLLLGCGLLYLGFFFLLAFQGQLVEALFPLALTPLIALFLSVPHYGSTLLRVYESRENRQKYQFFSVYLTGFIFLWFVAAVYNSLAGTLLVTLYMVWSPWHYMGQNYGVALMFLGRRKIVIPLGTKRWIHLSFLFSYLLTITEIQSFPSSGGFYQVLTLELANEQRDMLFSIFGLGYVLSLTVAVTALARHAALRDLLPTLLIVFSQALWFLVPLLAMRFGLAQGTVALSMDHAVYAFFWVAIAHAIQYLWITSYFAVNQQGEGSVPVFLGKALIVGALIWVVPAFLFSPNVIGNRSYGAGLAILIAAAVNVHHFVLDGAIWKLRDGRIASVLLRSVSLEAEQGVSTRSTLLKPALLAVGVLCVIAHYMGTVSSSSVRQNLALGDLESAENGIAILSTLQRDDPRLRQQFAQVALMQKDYDTATEFAKKAVELSPTEQNQGFLRSVERRIMADEAVVESDEFDPTAPFSPKLTR